jgi:hypothetical protein
MMMHQLMQDQANAATDEEEKLIIIATFLCLRARINAQPRREGSRPGKKKDKEQMQCVVMLENDYFADNSTHVPK